MRLSVRRARRARWTEHRLEHPDQETVSSDHAHGDERPNPERQRKERDKLRTLVWSARIGSDNGLGFSSHI